MSLLQLPNELLIMIAKELRCLNEFIKFRQTNKRLHSLLQDIYEIYDIPEIHETHLSCAAINGNTALASRMMEEMLTARIETLPFAEKDYLQYRRLVKPENLKCDHGGRCPQEELCRKGYNEDDILVIQNAFDDAVAHGQTEVVEMFVSRGAAVNHRNGKHNALHLAVANGSAAIVRILLFAGAYCNPQQCALLLACGKYSGEDL